MRFNYVISESKDKLINIVTIKGTYRSTRPKESLLDRAQLSYLAIKERYGVNVEPSATMLAKEMGCPSSTFEDNFCGINDFLAISERIVLDRFHEAVSEAEGDLDSVLRTGFQALYKVNPHSRFNQRKETIFDMNLRTRFAAEVFSHKYWALVFKPLVPVVDTYFAENIPRWSKISPEGKEDAFSLFAVVFRHTVLKMAIADLSKSSILDQKKQLNAFIERYKSQLWALTQNWLNNDYH